MRKFLIGLFTIFTSLMGMLSFNNSALANPVAERALKPVTPDMVKPVQLNVTASLWQLGDRNPHNIFAHLGCSCGACSQSAKTNTDATIALDDTF